VVEGDGGEGTYTPFRSPVSGRCPVLSPDSEAVCVVAFRW
jgi:hypothetical protein